ncbi:MAG: hypothetical protein VX641_02375 [Planctomycetota bacterium]|nr:hypothetical protein [Planctomycetota bacterium]
MKRSILLKAMLATYGLAALAGVLFFLSAGVYLVLDLLLTLLTVAGVLTVVLLCRVLAIVGNQRFSRLMDLGWIAAICSGACAITAIWVGGSGVMREVLFEIGPSSLFLCLAIMHLGFLFYWPVRDTLFLTIRWVLLAINLFFLSQLELLVINDDLLGDFAEFIGSDLYSRIISALVIIFCCGTVAIPLGYLIARSRQHQVDQAGLSPRVTVPVSCPRCGFHCELRVGHSTCPQCKLCFTLKLEEPRCRCGYLLYRVEADDCPECGRVIPDHVRWKTLDRSPEPSR